jgi:hypothetical protein
VSVAEQGLDGAENDLLRGGSAAGEIDPMLLDGDYRPEVVVA